MRQIPLNYETTIPQMRIPMAQQILPMFIEGESSINEKVHYEYEKSTNTVSRRMTKRVFIW